MVGKKIKYYRLKKGLTSEQLAKSIGCTKASISLYESDERAPNNEILQKIADALDVSWIHLIDDENKELTFEHLPPRKANNSNRAKAIVGDELTKHIAGNDKPWDFSSCKYKDLQKGMGLYSLCQACNNNTGTNYADEYIKFANTIGYAINKEKIDGAAEGFTIYLKLT